jgi:radical SAM superfamily enzyme YgiQ (UPF0313 family)
MGGPICNVVPERCRPHCDVLFEGEGEYTWKTFLDEWERGEHSDHYVQLEKIDLRDTPAPRIDLLKTEAYRVGCIQTTRGCPFNCEFCDITVTYGRKVRTKPIENVIAELQAWADADVDFVTVADDNLVGHRTYAKQMLRAVADWNRARRVPLSLYVEMSIDCVRNTELMALMREANVTEAFIGVESPRRSSLKEAKKFQNVASDLVAAVKTIQSYGMVTVAGMIVGFDADDEGIFEDQYEFLHAAGIPIVMLGILQAIPRTPLYDRLQKAGRLRAPTQGTNTLSFTNIEPLQLSYEQLIDGYRKLFCSLYTWEAIGQRWLDNVEQWSGDHPFIQRPMGRFKPFRVVQLARLAAYYLKSADRRRFAARMLWGTLRRAPRAVLQTVNYLGYFIHLREYADRVVAGEQEFNYAFAEGNFADPSTFGEAGAAINMVRQEKDRQQKIDVHDAYDGAELTADVAADVRMSSGSS